MNQPRVCFLINFPSGRPRAGSVLRMSADIATTTDDDDKLVFHSESVTPLQRNDAFFYLMEIFSREGTQFRDALVVIDRFIRLLHLKDVALMGRLAI